MGFPNKSIMHGHALYGRGLEDDDKFDIEMALENYETAMRMNPGNGEAMECKMRCERTLAKMRGRQL